MAKNQSQSMRLDRDTIETLLPPGPERTTMAEIISDFAMALVESWPTIGIQTLDATGQAPVSFRAKVTKGNPKMPYAFQIGMQPYILKGEGYLPDPNQMPLIEEKIERPPKKAVVKAAPPEPEDEEDEEEEENPGPRPPVPAAPKRRGRPPKAKPAEVSAPPPKAKVKAAPPPTVEEDDEDDFGDEEEEDTTPAKKAPNGAPAKAEVEEQAEPTETADEDDEWA